MLCSGDATQRRLTAGRLGVPHSTSLRSRSGKKAGESSHNKMTFSLLESQWSSRNSFKFAADRSNVATTARPQKEKLYEYTFVADLAPLTAFERPCKASRFRFRNKTSPTPSRRTPEWRRRRSPLDPSNHHSPQ